MKEKTICIVTTTRAEYGLLRPVIQRLLKIPQIKVQLVITGMHLSSEFGLTYKEIENDGVEIDEKISVLLSDDTPEAISKSMGIALISFSDYFKKKTPDLVLVLGDRFELLPICCVAMNKQIPIAHMHGGETTEGLIDEAIRHSITKMSYLHFTSTDIYRKRVIQLGESPERVFNVGAIGIENILKEKLYTKEELAQDLKFDLQRPYVMVTYHPVTLEGQLKDQIKALINVCQKHTEYNYIFTKANADVGGRLINQYIDECVAKNDNMIAFFSLGMKRYLSALKYCKMMVGNSSSGIIEGPTCHIPTINIGNRQKGRVQAKSIVNCGNNENDIEMAFETVQDKKILSIIAEVENPYGNGNTSNKIVSVIQEFLDKDRINLQKKFYDLNI